MAAPPRRPHAKLPLTARGQGLALLESILTRHGALDDALERLPGDDRFDRRDRALARALAMAVLRRLGEIDAILKARLARSMPKSRFVRNILRLGVADLLFVKSPAYAAIDGAVALAKTVGASPYAGLVNAVLRAVDRAAGEAQDVGLDKQEAARINTPKWLWHGWQEAYGAAQTQAIAAAHLDEPPLDLTVRAEPERWAERLAATQLTTGSLRLARRGPVTELPGYEEGAWWVQDAAAALPTRLFGDVAGARVLDLCAAPGGKTAQLAADGAKVTAVDRSPRRLARLRDNLARLGLEVATVEADAGTFATDQPFDAVLLDAPCTATGTLRRHPDIARLRSKKDVTAAADGQRELLSHAVDLVAGGGLLVYSVCSLEPAEGTEQIEALIGAGAPVERVPVQAASAGLDTEWIDDEGALRTLPCHLAELGGMDGFYAALLRRV
ncbi:MAG: RsmB/NOP family class I SAM-dependent RNA methyltransferase [Alphaproteobacteria bacterium]|nr:RsmB/NOP family class I SAM-dependent RNA methyltransferase [Alphaproteobacteria bacterium]